mgnify:CR=1 FL=1|jgi:hypothetical protein
MLVRSIEEGEPLFIVKIELGELETRLYFSIVLTLSILL